MNLYLEPKINRFISYVFPIILTIVTHFSNQYITDQLYIIPVLLLWISMGLLSLNPQISFIATTISFGLNYCLHALCSFISTIVISPFHYNRPSSPYILLALLTGGLQLLLTRCIFRYRRFHKGMPFIFSTSYINIATTICIIFLSFIMYQPSNRLDFNIHIFTLFIFIITPIILIHWWQAQITKSYKQALARRELESLRTELAEKDKLLVQLTRQNEELGRLIHHDNKRIPAMEHAVCEYLITDFKDSESALAKGNTLLLEIKELSQNRRNSLAEIYANTCKHHDTGIPSLDTMLNYMEKRALQEHIQFSVNLSTDLTTFVPNVIDTNDLTHILSDLLENAIIAATHSKTPTVQLQFYLSEKHFVLEVADNGIPFETISLMNFGLTQLTTHADTGGSGIGLMDIWKIKEKYAASLHISEYDKDSTYSKKITIIFDKKHRYSVSSYRKDELLQLSKRTDLQIF